MAVREAAETHLGTPGFACKVRLVLRRSWQNAEFGPCELSSSRKPAMRFGFLIPYLPHP